MTRYLRTRVGAARCLFPAGMVETVDGSGAALDAPYRDAAHWDAPHRIDARRLAPRHTGSCSARDRPGGAAVVLPPAAGRRWRAVLVDEVESFVDIDDREIAQLPAALVRLRPLFDGLWYEAERNGFQLRVRAAALRSFGERRDLLRAIGPTPPDAWAGRRWAGRR